MAFDLPTPSSEEHMRKKAQTWAKYPQKILFKKFEIIDFIHISLIHPTHSNKNKNGKALPVIDEKQSRWINTASVFRPLFLFHEKLRSFSSAFLYVHIRKNQTVTTEQKLSEKNFLWKVTALR